MSVGINDRENENTDNECKIIFVKFDLDSLAGAILT